MSHGQPTGGRLEIIKSVEWKGELGGNSRAIE